MSEFDKALDQWYSVANSDGEFEAVLGDDNRVTYQMVQPIQPYTEEDLNPYAIQGEVDPMTPGEFGQKTAGVATGTVGGALSATAGLLGDTIGFGEGLWAAATAEDQPRFEAFLDALAERSQQMGSEFFLDNFYDLVERSGFSEGFKEDIIAGSEYVGQWAEIPGAVSSLAALWKGRKPILTEIERSLKMGAEPAAQAPKQPGAEMLDVQTEAFAQPLSYEALPQISRKEDFTPEEWNRLTSDKTEAGSGERVGSELSLSQPIKTAQDAVEAAARNQYMLKTAGKEVAETVGVEFRNPGIKGKNDAGRRMAEKAKTKGGIRFLTDITRGGFVVDTAEQAEAVIAELGKSLKIVDEGYSVTPVGYFDRKLMVINPDGQVGEVQIWPRELIAAKDKVGHKLYEVLRADLENMTPAAKKEYDKLLKELKLKGTREEIVAEATERSKALYAEALSRTDPSLQAVIQGAAQ